MSRCPIDVRQAWETPPCVLRDLGGLVHVLRYDLPAEDLRQGFHRHHGSHGPIPLPMLETVQSVANVDRIRHHKQGTVTQGAGPELLATANNSHDGSLAIRIRVDQDVGQVLGLFDPNRTSLLRVPLKAVQIPQREAQILQRRYLARRLRGPQGPNGNATIVGRWRHVHGQSKGVLNQLVRQHVERATACEDDPIDVPLAAGLGQQLLYDVMDDALENQLGCGCNSPLSLHTLASGIDKLWVHRAAAGHPARPPIDGSQENLHDRPDEVFSWPCSGGVAHQFPRPGVADIL
mmetsp:Transcript_102024/g.288054  ORF Transcript_102024/g.288054 Transcript_102024/m.288054 type:complete len:291 (+) Transcript_102024:430-1302(+)